VSNPAEEPVYPGVTATEAVIEVREYRNVFPMRAQRLKRGAVERVILGEK